jgi:hypothetical protein
MRHFLVPMLAASLWLTTSGGNAQHGGDQDDNKARGARIAVIDFDYVDTSGEPRDQRKEHEARLEAFMLALKADLAERGGFRLATPLCSPNPCALVNDLLAAARTAGAEHPAHRRHPQVEHVGAKCQGQDDRCKDGERPVRPTVHLSRRYR